MKKILLIIIILVLAWISKTDTRGEGILTSTNSYPSSVGVYKPITSTGNSILGKIRKVRKLHGKTFVTIEVEKTPQFIKGTTNSNGVFISPYKDIINPFPAHRDIDDIEEIDEEAGVQAGVQNIGPNAIAGNGLNADGTVDSIDKQAVEKIIDSIKPKITQEEIDKADINRDGVINEQDIADLGKIINDYVGLNSDGKIDRNDIRNRIDSSTSDPKLSGKIRKVKKVHGKYFVTLELKPVQTVNINGSVYTISNDGSVIVFDSGIEKFTSKRTDEIDLIDLEEALARGCAKDEDKTCKNEGASCTTSSGKDGTCQTKTYGCICSQ